MNLINRLRCDIDQIVARLQGNVVQHAMLHFGPATFLKVVGSPVCATCEVAADEDPLCEDCKTRYFNAAFGGDATLVIVCTAHKGE